MILDKDKKDHDHELDETDQESEEKNEGVQDDADPEEEQQEEGAPKEYAFDSHVSDADTLSNYIRNVNKFPMLEAEEEYELARKWSEEGDNASANKIVQSHLRLIGSVRSKMSV